MAAQPAPLPVPNGPPDPAQGQAKPPGMPPEQAMAMLKQYGINDPGTAQQAKMALEALEAAGMLPEGPENEPEEGNDNSGAMNAQMAQMLAG